jgi:hypothetical protein
MRKPSQLRWGLGRHARGFSICLMKDTHNLRLKFREFDGEHEAAGMEDEIEALGEQVDMAAQGLAHPALDAISLVRFAHHFADGEPQARPNRQRRPGVSGLLRANEPTHGG